jgi:hypothetical protein
MIAELRDLGRRIDVGTPADQRAAVRSRLGAPVPHPTGRRVGHKRLRRWWAAVAAALVGTILMVPPARAAVVDAVDGLLRIAGVEIRADAGPRALPASPAPLPGTRPVDLAEARRLARFTVAAPTALGEPERVTVTDQDATGAPRVVTLFFRGGAVRLDGFDGGLDIGFVKSARDMQWVDLGGRSAIWLPTPHPITYLDRAGVAHTEAARLSGPTLVWYSDTVTYRLEGITSVAEARRIAASVR